MNRYGTSFNVIDLQDPSLGFLTQGSTHLHNPHYSYKNNIRSRYLYCKEFRASEKSENYTECENNFNRLNIEQHDDNYNIIRSDQPNAICKNEKNQTSSCDTCAAIESSIAPNVLTSNPTNDITATTAESVNSPNKIFSLRYSHLHMRAPLDDYDGRYQYEYCCQMRRRQCEECDNFVYGIVYKKGRKLVNNKEKCAHLHARPCQLLYGDRFQYEYCRNLILRKCDACDAIDDRAEDIDSITPDGYVTEKYEHIGYLGIGYRFHCSAFRKVESNNKDSFDKTSNVSLNNEIEKEAKFSNALLLTQRYTHLHFRIPMNNYDPISQYQYCRKMSLPHCDECLRIDNVMAGFKDVKQKTTHLYFNYASLDSIDQYKFCMKFRILDSEDCIECCDIKNSSRIMDSKTDREIKLKEASRILRHSKRPIISRLFSCIERSDNLLLNYMDDIIMHNLVHGAELKDVIERSSRANWYNNRGFLQQPADILGETNTSQNNCAILGIRVPSTKYISEIVGLSGYKIKELREQSGAMITTPNLNEDHVFLVEAAPEMCIRIAVLLSTRANKLSHKYRSLCVSNIDPHINKVVLANKKVFVPQELVSRIIGVEGCIIKAIQLVTSTYIESPERDSSREPTEMVIFDITCYNDVASRTILAENRVSRAVKLIEHMVMYHKNKTDREDCLSFNRDLLRSNSNKYPLDADLNSVMELIHTESRKKWLEISNLSSSPLCSVINNSTHSVGIVAECNPISVPDMKNGAPITRGTFHLGEQEDCWTVRTIDLHNPIITKKCQKTAFLGGRKPTRK